MFSFVGDVTLRAVRYRPISTQQGHDAFHLLAVWSNRQVIWQQSARKAASLLFTINDVQEKQNREDTKG